MKVKFLHLESIIKAFKELNECRMSFATKIKLRDAQETLMKEAEWFEDQRIELLTMYSKKDADGQPVIQDGNYILENEGEFKLKFYELLNTKFEIKPLDASLIENLELSGTAWDGLMHIIE